MASSCAFPNPWTLPPDSDGLVYIGGDLEPETLVSAYEKGIYPWPFEELYPLFWFCPEQRGVLDFTELHVPRSLEKVRKKSNFHVTFDRAFDQVIDYCSKQPRPGQKGTWITPSMVEAYKKFHRLGYAHSVECWNAEKLVGGLYGVYVRGVFSGESMFHLEPNASKISLITLIEKLREHGLDWIDIQMVTPVTGHLGGKYIPRRDFLTRIKQSQARGPGSKILLS